MYRFTYLIETLINGENVNDYSHKMYTTTPKPKHKIHHQ